MAIFPTFLGEGGGQYTAGKCLLRYSRTKKRLSTLQKQQVQTVKKIDVFPKGLSHGIGPKIANFSTLFFGYIGQENVFSDVLERKNAFLGYKYKKFKKSKN